MEPLVPIPWRPRIFIVRARESSAEASRDAEPPAAPRDSWLRLGMDGLYSTGQEEIIEINDMR